MNLGLVHPYIYHLNSFILIMLFLSWLGSYIKRDSWILNISLIITNYLGVSGAAILSSIIIISGFHPEFYIKNTLTPIALRAVIWYAGIIRHQASFY